MAFGSKRIMKHRIASLLLALTLSVSLLSINAFADLPKGYWPVWSAYDQAAESGADDATLLEKGDAVINFYSKYEKTPEIANQLFVIYSTRLNRLIYENRGDWEGAIANTRALQDICNYQISIGNDADAYAEWLPRCAAHLAALEPFHGVYAASYTQSKTYGSKIAPASGAFYGTPMDGCYNDRSIVSFYVNVENETAEGYSHYIDEKADGSRVILINLNFQGEGSTARSIPSGSYDASLRTTFSYLAGLNCPVLVRIGAEANVWTDEVSPADFIKAYNYVASMARSIAPKAELVWSPNYSSGWGVNLADYYPDNSLVDWVGLSLYYNYTNPGGNSTEWLEFTHAGRFADPIGNAAEVVAVARAKGKPVIATEGGAVDTGSVPNYKANQVSKEFRELTMVYPEVKALLHFDKTFNGNDYRLTGNARSKVDQAIAANPTLLEAGERSAATFIPITQLNEKMSGKLVLGATGRTYRNMNMAPQFTLDGKQISSSAYCEIDLSGLSQGAHRLDVSLNDGGSTKIDKTYTLNYTGGIVKVTEGYKAPATPAAPAAPAMPQVVPTRQKLTVDGVAKNTEIYNIGGSNYFKLRDMAALLNGTSSQFSVDFDNATGLISIKTGAAYAPNGKELATLTEAEMNEKAAKAVSSSPKLLINGETVDNLTAYNLAGNNFFKLRDLGKALNFDVDYDGSTATMIVKSK